MKANETKKTPAQKPAKETKRTRSENYMLIKSGLDREGRQQYTATRVYSRMPKGWKETKGATTAPKGYKWISNGKSLLGGKRKSALIKE